MVTQIHEIIDLFFSSSALNETTHFQKCVCCLKTLMVENKENLNLVENLRIKFKLTSYNIVCNIFVGKFYCTKNTTSEESCCAQNKDVQDYNLIHLL